MNSITTRYSNNKASKSKMISNNAIFKEKIYEMS